MSSSKPGDDRFLAGALRYARTGARSRQDVLTYLERRGASSRTITRVLDTCTALGLVDDQACARLWAEHWVRRGYAQAAIHQRLTAKALDAAAIEHAVNTVARASDDEARARLVVARHLGRGGRPPRSLPAPPHASLRKAKQGGQAGRLARTLASRGFDPDVIERVLNESFGLLPSE